MVFEPASRGAFIGVSAVLFAAGAAVTIAGRLSLSAVGRMPLPGGSMLSMARMPVAAQPGVGAAVAFLGMWVAMMAAMMLPSLVPALWRYRQAVGGFGEGRPGWRTAAVGAGYFAVWTGVGVAAYPLCVALAAARLRVPALGHDVAPAAFLIAGALQLTRWKAHHLTCCRRSPAQVPALPESAWRYGLRLGTHCACCTAPLLAILLAAGVMDLRAMAIGTAAITLERLAPAGERVARAVGVVAVGVALALLGRAAGLV